MKTLSMTKKIFITLFFAISLFFANCIALTSTFTAQALVFTTYTSEVSVTNGDFTSYSTNSNKLPYSVSSGWTVPSSPLVYSGVVDTTEKTFTDKNGFTLSENPKTSESIDSADSYVYMIKAMDTSTKYGITSNSISLSANKFYVVSVYVKTGLKKDDSLIENTNSKFSIYTSLTDHKNTNTNFVLFNTNGNWQEYRFFVATDTFGTSSLSVDLRLGSESSPSSGVVFFDHFTVKEIANNDFYSMQNSSLSIYDKIIDLKNSDRTTLATNFTNPNFENDLTGWTVTSGIGNVYTPILQSINNTIKSLDNSITNGADNFVYDNDSKALFINNQNDDYTKVTSTDTNTISISQHGYYLLTAFVKTGNLSGDGLTITLDEKVEDNSITLSQTNITTNDSADEYNGFNRVCFYIKGSEWKNSNVGISFELGSSDNNVTGWAIIDNIGLQKISESEYTSNSSTSTALDLSKNITGISSIENGSFDSISSSMISTNYPLSPSDWTYSNDDELSGIIRVKSEYFNSDCSKFGLTPYQNPGVDTAYPAYKGLESQILQDDNVLMIRAKKDKTASYKSSSLSLSSNATSNTNIDKVEVGVKTIGNAKAFIKVVDEDGTVLALINNISASSWTTYSLYIKNGISSKTVYTILGVEGQENDNYAFFDYANFSTSVSDDVSTIKSKENSCYIDLITDSFYSYSNKKIDNLDNTYEAINWSVYSLESSSASALNNGIIKSSNIVSLNAREDANSKNLLVVKNGISSYQVLQSNYSYELKSGSYYEFSVYSKTDFAGFDNQNNFGAYFEIASVNTETNELNVQDDNKNKFVNFSTSSSDNNWTKYSIYVYAENDETVKVLLGLGTQTNPTTGIVYFDDVTVQNITESEYTSKSENDTTIISKVITKTESTTDNDSDNSSTATTSQNSLNFFALFSSIILAVALVLAIAGYLIRRIPKKKMSKVATSDYSVKPTQVDERAVKQELKTTRENKLAKLEDNLNKLKEKRASIQDEYEKKANKEESLTEKNKIYTKYTKQINKLTKQIEYIESALTFSKDSANIKMMEQLEIKNKKKEAINEFIKLKNEDSNK